MGPKNDKDQQIASPRFTYGAGEKSRTPDLRITNALLYQLSYAGVALAEAGAKPRILAEPGSGATLTPALFRVREREKLHFIANSGSFFATATFFSVAYTGKPCR